jgi:hypothetical protein
MADESMVRNLDAQARAIWPQEVGLLRTPSTTSSSMRCGWNARRFAAILAAWRDGYLTSISELTPFDSVWMVPVVSARIPAKREATGSGAAAASRSKPAGASAAERS